MAFPPLPLIIYNNHKKITQAMITRIQGGEFKCQINHWFQNQNKD